MLDGNSKALSRRRFIKSGAMVAATAVGTIAAPQVSRAQGVVLRMQSTWPADQIFHEMAQEYVDRVERMAGRRLRIDLRPGGTIVPGIELHDACNDGRLDAGHAGPVFLGLRHPAISLFTAGHAFGADAAMMFAWMHRGGGQELYDELLNVVVGPNLISFYTLPMPNQPFGWFRQPLTSPGDLVGLRFRIVGGGASLARKMGMVVALITPGEVPQYMERGLLDGFELNNPSFDRRLGAHEVAKHYMMASFHQPVEFLEVLFNKARFQSLPDEHQAILRYAAEAASTANYSTALDEYSRDLQTLIEEDGVTVSRTPDAILDRQLEAWDEVIAEESADPLFAKIVASQKAWCERVGFYQSMNTPDYRRAYRHAFPDRM